MLWSICVIFFFKQKTAYEVRISDWSSDVCSSDLIARWLAAGRMAEPLGDLQSPLDSSVRLSLRLVPYSDDLWLLIVRDVTRLVRLEHMRRDFVDHVSHELRTPLKVLHGYLAMLSESGPGPAEHDEWAPRVSDLQRNGDRKKIVEGREGTVGQ